MSDSEDYLADRIVISYIVLIEEVSLKRYCGLTEGRLTSYNRTGHEPYKEIVSQWYDN